MYVDIITRDNAQNLRLCDELYKRREQDVQEKADIDEFEKIFKTLKANNGQH